ncbi:MAG: nuclear transport factor 2 family protein [Rhodospirillales bacterium]
MDHTESDRLAIRELIEAYSDALNTRDFATMAQFFTETAIWRADPPFALHFEGAAIAKNIAAMVANYPVLLQMTHGIVVAVEGDHATARTTIHEIGQATDGASGLNSFGIYHDELLRTARGWRFAARRFQGLLLDTAPLPGNVVGTLGNEPP